MNPGNSFFRIRARRWLKQDMAYIDHSLVGEFAKWLCRRA